MIDIHTLRGEKSECVNFDLGVHIHMVPRTIAASVCVCVCYESIRSILIKKKWFKAFTKYSLFIQKIKNTLFFFFLFKYILAKF